MSIHVLNKHIQVYTSTNTWHNMFYNKLLDLHQTAIGLLSYWGGSVNMRGVEGECTCVDTTKHRTDVSIADYFKTCIFDQQSCFLYSSSQWLSRFVYAERD